jgi:DNA-binding HxlR family transcriptional regulator
MLILRNAFDGMRRFGEFQRDLKLSKSVLAARLHALIAHGVLRTAPGQDGSAYQEYELTEKGRGFFQVITGLRQWGEAFLFAPGEDHSVLVERASGKPIGQLEIRSRSGRLLTPAEVVVRKVQGAEKRPRKQS